jgi:GNAT superfamily N-acetyltransferase
MAALELIRIAGPDDLEAIRDLIEAAYRGSESLTGWTSEGDIIDGERLSREQLADVLADPATLMLVSETTDGVITGCASISRKVHGAEFGKFAVRPALQNAGAGKRILAACENAFAREWGGGLMTMTVIRGRSELIAFYERRGYRATGESLPLAKVHDTPGWTKGRDLILDVYAKQIEPPAED